MKIFMSWSGERSRAAAELLVDWIKCVIQVSRPWISSRDIDRGALWFSEINNELMDTRVGIVCLTQENKNKPWILFESGALAKGLSTSRVCTFLVDLKPADLQDPLAQFNHTIPLKGSVRNLIITLNSAIEVNQLDSRVLDEVFETYWPQFEMKFAALLEKYPEVPVAVKRDEKDMLSDILDATRGLSQRLRNVEENVSFADPLSQPGAAAKMARGGIRMNGVSDEDMVSNLLSRGLSPHQIYGALLETNGIGPIRARTIMGKYFPAQHLEFDLKDPLNPNRD